MNFAVVSRIVGWIGLGLGIVGCANVVNPDGGARDQTPPKLLRVTPPDQSLNTWPRQIVFEFDEYIQLKDPQAVRWGNVPAGTVKAQARLRKLIIRLNPDSLSPRSTYGVDLGGSVADITEGNAISSLGFAFSTGDYLDSLQWSGQVRDAETDLPLRGITVALYPQAVWPSLLQGDSIKPERWTLTNDSGFFVFRNLPNISYTVLAFRDPERDRLFGKQLPKAFLSELQAGATGDSGEVMYFSEDFDAQTNIRNTLWSDAGSLAIIFRGSPKPVQAWGIQENGLVLQGMGQEISGDTLWVHVPPNLGALAPKFALRLSAEGNLDTLCTIEPKPLSSKVMGLGGPGVLMWGASDFGALRRLRWDRAVHMVDPLAWCWQSDQGKEIPVEGDFFTGTQEISLRVDFANNDFAPEKWVLRIDSGAFEDGYGRHNKSFLGKLQETERLSTVILRADSLLSEWQNEEHRVVSLWTSSGRWVASHIFRNLEESASPWIVDGLLPGKYKISLLEDRNRNGRWDAAWFKALRQPEKIKWLSRDLELKPGWTTELRWR
ncbi:MAG: Ig-like domain-containing protein [Bacteroidota bacterium]